MADFSIRGVDYQSKLFDGETQLYVMKRLLPAFTALMRAAPDLRLMVGGDEQTSSIVDILAPVSTELARMSDADVGFVINACLDVTSRKAAQGVGWAGVRQNGVIQDRTDSDFAVRMQIAWHVIAENFSAMFASYGLDIQTLMSAGRAGI